MFKSVGTPNKTTLAFIEELQENMKKNPPKPLAETSMPEYRANVKGFQAFRATNAEGVTIEDINPISGPDDNSIPIRKFVPDDVKDDTNGPAIIFFHGGGFVANLDCHDAPCSKLAKAAGAKVFLVDYRLAPENKFPAGVNDAYTAAKYFSEHTEKYGFDKNKLIVAGDSSGGNFAALVAIRARDAKAFPISQVILISPATDLTRSSHTHDSYAEKDVLLNSEAIDWLYDQYIPEDVKRNDPTLSPFFSKDLGGLPPHVGIIAEFDGQRSDFEAYMNKLEAAGNEVTRHVLAGQIHSFFIARGKLDEGDDPAIVAGEAVAKKVR